MNVQLNVQLNVYDRVILQTIEPLLGDEPIRIPTRTIAVQAGCCQNTVIDSIRRLDLAQKITVHFHRGRGGHRYSRPAHADVRKPAAEAATAR